MDAVLPAKVQISPPGGAIGFARLVYGAKPELLQGEVAPLLQDGWVDHVNKKDYSGGWDVLPLRCQQQHINAHPVLQGFAIAEGDVWKNLPVLEQCPEIRRLLSSIDCPIRSVRLMRLKAGADIKPHRDVGLSADYGEARLHVPIHTSEQVEFIVNHRVVPMRAGELWYINADQEHAVRNLGREDRINLVIDCVATDWLRSKIAASAKNHS